MRHGAGATMQDDIQRIPPREGKADLLTERRQPGLLHRSRVSRLLAFQCVTDRTFQQSRVKAALDQVIGGTRLHRLQIHFVLALPGHQNDGRTTAALRGRLEQLDSVVRSQPVVDQTNVVLIARHCLETGGKVLHPVDLDQSSAELGKQIACDDVIILVILDEENAQRAVGIGVLH